MILYDVALPMMFQFQMLQLLCHLYATQNNDYSTDFQEFLCPKLYYCNKVMIRVSDFIVD